MPTKIEWTKETWNPVTGCTKISEGCKNCYAERWAKRHQVIGTPGYENGFKVTFHTDKLNQPLHWKKPRRIFVCSMGDLFHEDVSLEFIQQVFEVITACPQHIFQVLTKRPQNVPSWFWQYIEYYRNRSNIWLGVTTENQQSVDKRIPELLTIPAAVRFLSCEPLLQQIDLTHLIYLDWVIVGGETGAGWRYGCEHGWSYASWAKPMTLWLRWARDIRDQCKCAGIPFFFKKPPGGGKLMEDGFTANTPEDLKIREWPRQIYADKD